MKFLALAVVFLFLSSFAWAEVDNSKWCGTITAIYGVCSPELVANYLLMTKNHPKRPNTIRASVVLPNLTATLVKGAETGIIPPNSSTVGVGVADPPLPLIRITYYWNGVVWVKGRFVE